MGRDFFEGGRGKALDLLALLGAAEPLGVGDPMGTAWLLDGGRVVLPGLGTLQGLQSCFQNKKERDLGPCNPFMSIEPPSKTLPYHPAPAPADVGTQPTFIPPTLSPHGCNSASTACEPGHRGAGDEANVCLQPPLLIPFSTGRRSGNSSLLGSWKK